MADARRTSSDLAGSLPPDLALVNGVVTGTPKTPGSFTFTVIASDSADPPSTVTVPFTLVVVLAGRQVLLRVDPTRVALSAASAGHGSNAVTISVTDSAGRLAWRVSADVPWLRLAPASGAGPGSFTVSADTSGMKRGSYAGAITLTMDGAANSPQRIPVELTIE